MKSFGNEVAEGTTSFSIKWLTVNKEVVYKRIINCTKAAELTNIEKYLCEIKYKWRIKSVIHS
jgi:hypothetical protein